MQVEDDLAPPSAVPPVDDGVPDVPPQANDVAANGLSSPDGVDSEAKPAMPTTGSSARPKSPIVHGSYEKADSDDEEVMVKTEFVWADGAEFDVKLSGAWNGWMPVQMYHEGGKSRL